MKTIIKCTNGTVAIMTLVEGADLETALGKWKIVNPGKYLSHRQMEDSAIPTSREFREAWTDSTPEPVIDIDMDKVRRIQSERLKGKDSIALNAIKERQLNKKVAKTLNIKL